MPKKIEPLANWVSANDAAKLLGDKLGYPVAPRYLRQLAKRKKKPVRTQSLGYHQLYNRMDLLKITIRQRKPR